MRSRFPLLMAGLTAVMPLGPPHHVMLLMGGVSEYVLHHLDRPVLMSH